MAVASAIAPSAAVIHPLRHGYDLLSTAPLRLLHHGDGARLRMMPFRELRAVVRDLPVDQAILTPGLAGLVVRFLLRKRSTAL